MARTSSIFAFVIAATMLDCGIGATKAPAQQPSFYASSHPYLAMARYNESRWRADRPAASFDYKPHFPNFYQGQKPFALATLPPVGGIARDAVADRHASQLREFADELEYYGFGDLAGDFIP